jgi:hypothetical protein
MIAIFSEGGHEGAAAGHGYFDGSPEGRFLRKVSEIWDNQFRRWCHICLFSQLVSGHLAAILLQTPHGPIWLSIEMFELEWKVANVNFVKHILTNVIGKSGS